MERFVRGKTPNATLAKEKDLSIKVFFKRFAVTENKFSTAIASKVPKR